MGSCSKSVPPAQHKAPDPPPPQHIKGLNVQIDLKNLELFKAVLAVIGEFVMDDRIPEPIRLEYVSKMTAIKD